MAMKKSVWDMILKVVIAVASALAGVLGANAMNQMCIRDRVVIAHFYLGVVLTQYDGEEIVVDVIEYVGK